LKNHISYEAREARANGPQHESWHSIQSMTTYALWFSPNVQCNIPRFLKRAARLPLGATERFPGGRKQKHSLGSFAVILHNTSVMIYWESFERGHGSWKFENHCNIQNMLATGKNTLQALVTSYENSMAS